MTLRRVGRAKTDTPERYLKQLVSHLGHRLTTRVLDDHGREGELVLDVGRCLLRADPGVLVLDCTAEDDAGLARVRDVAARHLERFGAKEDLRVEWEDGG